MTQPRANHVAYYATKYGYRVTVLDADSNVLEQYDAGNHRGISEAWIDPASPDALSLAKLKQFAKETAIGTAAKWNLHATNCYWDQDSADDEIAMFAQRRRGAA